MKIKRRIAALGAAVMMMASVSAIGASATESFSLYISNSGSVTSKTLTAGYAAQDDYVKVNYKINSISNGVSVKYLTLVGGSTVASGTISTKGNHTITHSDSTYIDKGERILVTLKLNPNSSGTGSSASGTVTGS